MGKGRGHIIIVCTPRYHPELVGEGIEYSWGCENNYHSPLSLDKKKSYKNKNVFNRKYQEITLPQIRFVYFVDVHRNIPLHKNG